MNQGIMAEFRNKGIDIHNQKYFKIFAQQEWVKTGNDYFCGKSWLQDGDVHVLFDGDLNTVYAQDDQSTENKNITIEFVKKPIFIRSFSLKTACNPPKELVVEGSNDGIKWEEIYHGKTALPEYQISTFSCDKPGTFRIIRIYQIGTTCSGNYRMHLSEIEFYGRIANSCTQWCKKKQFLSSFMFFVIFSLVS